MNVIGMDVGHSAVKVAVSGSPGGVTTILIPTAVCRAFKISDEAEAARAALETVRVGSTEYFVGQTALIQGGSGVSLGLSEDWIETPEYSALVLAAHQAARRVLDRGGDGGVDVKIVMGLPTSLYSRQKSTLQGITERLLGVKDVRVVPQAMGPYFEMAVGLGGLPNVSFSAESWAVVEIGYFTTDIMLMMNGRWVEKASGTCAGARVAAEHLQRILGDQGITADLSECEQALRDRTIRDFRVKRDVSEAVDSAVAILAAEVADTSVRLMEPFVRKLDGVIVAGGGAEILFKEIQARWPHAICPKSPRFSVAEGMRRFAAMLAIKAAMGVV